MIPRYTTSDMQRIWSDENKFNTWKKVELEVVSVLTDHGEIPREAEHTILEKADFNVDRILEIEKTTRHDVIAFLTCMAEYIGPDSRFVHMGMTSSDLLDTSLALLCKEAGEVILQKLEQLHKLLRKQALRYRDTLQIGRSHGVHAEPITFGLKLALWSEEVGRHVQRLQTSIMDVATGKISGAVGTYQHLDPEVEIETCRRLGLQAATVSSQIVQRDHHAQYLQVLALIGATLEKIAVEIRHMQRTEVLEAEEPFTKGQKGSSAMPHKRNPIVTERITGMARLLRSNAHVGLENVALWHERDISHSSVERVIIPDSTSLLDYMLMKMLVLIENLQVYPERMLRNLALTGGLIYSQEVLLALIKKGMTREDSYSIVQRNAMATWEGGADFQTSLLTDEIVQNYLTAAEITDLFNKEKILSKIKLIFKRIGLGEQA